MSRRGQLSLFAAEGSAGRAMRMGSVERDHWQLPTGEERWERSAGGWSAQGEVTSSALLGVDEAGRGPLAGPVSVAGVVLSPGQVFGEERLDWVKAIDDSKRLTDAMRRRLFGKIISTARGWSIAHIHADHVDRVNILKATFHGMAIVVEQLLGEAAAPCSWEGRPALRVRRVEKAAGHAFMGDGCWYASALEQGIAPQGGDVVTCVEAGHDEKRGVLLLIDGNMTCDVQGSVVQTLEQRAVVKGDTLSIHIAAASVLAKVSRDQMMVLGDRVWPGYGFSGHKGYPTRGHKEALREKGLSPLHRRSFKY